MTFPIRFAQATALAAALLSLTGTACSGAGGGSNSGGPLDACTLIGAQRAGAILGQDVTTRHVGPEATTASDPSRCMYLTGSFGGGFLLNAKRIHYSDAQAAARSRMQATTSTESTQTLMSGGPGEAAWLFTMADATQLNVIDHGVWLVVNINQPDSPAIRARLRKLARAAIDHRSR